MSVSATKAQDGGSLGAVLKGSGLSSTMLGALKKTVEKLPQSTTNSNRGGKPNNLATFPPTPQSKNLEKIAAELAKTPEERKLFLELFTQTKQAYEQQAASAGGKNNLAGAMTFLLATCVTVYNDGAEPSDAVTDKLFHGLNAMLDSVPDMARAPAKDKEFLYDTYISFAAMTFTGYREGQQSNNDTVKDQFRVLAGSVLREAFGIDPSQARFDTDGLHIQNSQNAGGQQVVQSTSTTHTFKKRITHFDDGWTATPTDEYVRVQHNGTGTEIRLFYINKALDDAQSNYVTTNDYYWESRVVPFFNASEVTRWEGVQYPEIHFMSGDAVDRQTGKPCFVAMKVVYHGGANVIVAVAPNRAVYEQQFKHPDDLNSMLNRNHFAVTAEDIVGKWGSSGGGMDGLSTSDEFVFHSNGRYHQTYLSAQGSQFARIDYDGRFTVTEWEVTATNHFEGKTAKFAAHLIAVHSGYLLFLVDQRNNVTTLLFKQEFSMKQRHKQARGGSSRIQVDTTFGHRGAAFSGYRFAQADCRAIIAQPDGPITLIGTVAELRDSPSCFGLFRFDQNGALDQGFGTDGCKLLDLGVDGAAWAAALQQDAKILVAGETLDSKWGTTDFALVRLNADGQVDSSFGKKLVETDFGWDTDDRAHAVAVQQDGKIVAAGYTTYPSQDAAQSKGHSKLDPQLIGSECFALARYETDGTLDHRFGTGGRVITGMATSLGGSARARALHVEDDGCILACGFATSGPNEGAYKVAVARYQPDGTLDESFGDGGRVLLDAEAKDEKAYSLSVHPGDGTIVIAGEAATSSSASHFLLVRLDASGNLDSTFNNCGRVIDRSFEGGARAVITLPDGRIIAAGDTTRRREGKNDEQFQGEGGALVCYLPDGSPDISFGDGGILRLDLGSRSSDVVHGIVLDGEKILVGATSPIDREKEFAVARFEFSDVQVTPGMD